MFDNLGPSEISPLPSFLSALISDAPSIDMITSVDLAIAHMLGILSSRYQSTEFIFFESPTSSKGPSIACPFPLLGGLALLNGPCFARMSCPYELRTHLLDQHYNSDQRQYRQRPCPNCKRIGAAESGAAQGTRDCLDCCFILRQDQYDQISCKASQSRKATEEVERIFRIITNVVPLDPRQNQQNVSLSENVRLWIKRFLDFIARSKICDVLCGIYDMLPLEVREQPDCCRSQAYMVNMACVKWLLGALKHCGCQEAGAFVGFQENSSWWYELFSFAA